jgi:hypothetical protein
LSAWVKRPSSDPNQISSASSYLTHYAHKYSDVYFAFSPESDDVTAYWRKLHSEELHDLHCSPNIVRVIRSRMRWAGYVTRMGDRRDACRVLVMKPERKIPLGRPRRKWKDNIKIGLEEIGLAGVDCIYLVQYDKWGAVVNTVMNFRVPLNTG